MIMFYPAKVLLLLLGIVMLCNAQVADNLKGLLAKLEDESFDVREKASQDLVAYDISIKELAELIK